MTDVILATRIAEAIGVSVARNKSQGEGFQHLKTEMVSQIGQVTDLNKREIDEVVEQYVEGYLDEMSDATSRDGSLLLAG